MKVEKRLWVFGLAILFALNTFGQGSKPLPLDTLCKNAIQSAVGYINGRGQLFMPDVQLMVHFIARKYPVGISAEFIEGTGQMIRNPQWSASELRYYFRVVDPDYRVSTDEMKLASGFNWLTAHALYCDLYGLPAHFADSLIAYNRGSYDRTHAAFALAWILEKGCAADSESGLAQLQHEMEDGLVELIDERGADTDVGVEAIAMLMQFGAYSKVKPAWIETLIQAQFPEGYWAEKPESKRPNDHTTALALWALLEYTYPNQAFTPWVKTDHESH